MILVGDVLEQLKKLPNESVQCCVTTPPYWGLKRRPRRTDRFRENPRREYVASWWKSFARLKSAEIGWGAVVESGGFMQNSVVCNGRR